MKKIILSLLFLCTVCSISFCKKNSPPSGSSAFTIVNTLVNSTPVVTNFSQIAVGGKLSTSLNWYNSALQIGYGTYSELSSYAGMTLLSLSQISDTLVSLWNGLLNLSVGSTHSLFIIGADTTNVDTLFTTDVIPYYPYTGDSVTGIRLVNVSPGSNPISVDIQGATGAPLVTNLSYKGITGFQALPATSVVQTNGYTIEFRDAASGTLLTTYSLPIVLFKSQTLAFYGTALSGQLVMAINNF
jgi:hypothetical protein